MSQNRSRYEIRQEASLSQKLADKIPLYQNLAGSDKEVSDSIAILSYLKEQGIIGGEIDFLVGLLNVLRMSAFATSERVNEITKMGLQMPRAESEVEFDESD